MDHEDNYSSLKVGSTERSGQSWGAKDSLKRNVRKNIDEEEDAPLLGNGSGSIDENGSMREVEWEGMADFEGLPWWRKPSVYWLIPSFFLFALAFGGTLVPKVNLTLSLICRQYFLEQSSLNPDIVFTPVQLDDDNSECRKNDEVQALATKFILYITIITGFLSAIMSPRLGALSDRVGRIKILVFMSIGSLVTEGVTILAYTYPDSVSYKWLLAGAIFDGLCGSFTTALSLVHAYASDCTAPPKRAVAFGYFHACLFSGIALGPMIVAVIIHQGGTLLAIFYIALAVHLFFITFILVVVPESLSKKRQQHAQEKYATEAAEVVSDEYSWAWAYKTVNILSPLKVLWPTGPGTSRRLRVNLVLLAAVDTIIFGIAMGALSVLVLYCGYQFNWKTDEVSAFVSVVNVFRVTGLVVILPALNYIVRTRRANKQRQEFGFAIPEPNSGSDLLDLHIVRSSIFMEIIGFGGYAIARDPRLFLVAGIFAALGGIGSPTLQSALTKHVPHDRVGALLGATGLLHALARIVGPTIFSSIYAKTVGKFTQAVWVVLCSCFVVAFIVSWFIQPHIYLNDKDEPSSNEESIVPGYDPDAFADEEVTGA